MTSEQYWKAILEILYHWSDLGIHKAKTGATLIGHVPHVAPEAWLHSLHIPLKKKQISALEESVGTTFPYEFRDFLGFTNGLKAYSDSISIYGIRTNYDRTIEGGRQPYDFQLMNRPAEKPPDAENTMVFIGGYSWMYGSDLYFDSGSLHPERIYRCSRESVYPLNTWENFWVMLDEELKRLAAMFDDKGRQIDPEKPTVPAPQDWIIN